MKNFFLDRAKKKEAVKIKEVVDEFGHKIQLPPGLIKLPPGLQPIPLDDTEEQQQD